MLKTILCDDEGPARDLLAGILRDIDSVEIVASCQSAGEALDLINAGGVDLVFFDVEMPELTGVAAAGRLSIEPRPWIVFATAHPDYAIDAFGIDAIDYILKPFDPERVHRAVDKAERLQRLVRETEDDAAMPEKTGAPEPQGDALRITDAGRLYVIPHAEIVWIEAAGDYSLIHREGSETAIRCTLSSLEQLLPPAKFKRVHRSTIIALDRISEVKRLARGEAEIQLRGGEMRLRSSRSYRSVIEELISQNS